MEIPVDKLSIIILGVKVESFSGTGTDVGMPHSSCTHVAFKPWGGNYNYVLHFCKVAEGGGGALYHGMTNDINTIPTTWHRVAEIT